MKLCLAVLLGACAVCAQDLPSISANDNRKPAGALRDNVLHVELEMRKGNWHPESEDGEAIPSYAFAEPGKPLQAPGPAIRVPLGATVDITLRNTLAVPVTLFGLHERPGNKTASITVEAGATQHVRFPAGRAGTYLYWARTPDGRRGNGRVLDALLGGALVVDQPGDDATKDRIFVLERWNGPTRTAINGKSWPYTERLNFQVGEKVRWRIVNASDLSHPMHLHGFHFRLDGEGDGEHYKVFDEGVKPEEFTHSVEVMETFDMSWTPKEPGRWLYHCHRIPHMRLPVPLDAADATLVEHNHDHEHMHDMDSPYAGMGGMIMGITVSGRPTFDTETGWKPTRRLEMRIAKRESGQGYEIALRDQVSGAETRSRGLAGPLLVVRQGEQTEIAITNATRETTVIHWHGLEIESYYDGVPGWGGLGDKKAPALEPGKTFNVRMVPRRAGSFIYHTHWHDAAQLTGGIHGSMVVLAANQKWDPDTDKSFQLSASPDEPYGQVLLMNGVPQPAAMRLRVGTTYRLRFMNITPTGDNMRIGLRGPGEVQWKPLAKDAADLRDQHPRAAEQHIAVGETYDFEYRANAAGEVRLEAWIPGDQRRVVQTLIFSQ
ncbi:MAG: multicopper oxidase domain-containing protein [Bryobacteraceae bacterium]